MLFLVTKIEMHYDLTFLSQQSSLSRSLRFRVYSLFTLPLSFSTPLFSVPGAEKAQLYTLRTAKTLAMTAVDVVCCPDLLRQVREDFEVANRKQEK